MIEYSDIMLADNFFELGELVEQVYEADEEQMDPKLRSKMLIGIKQRATRLGCKSEIAELIKKKDAELQEEADKDREPYVIEIRKRLQRDEKGKIVPNSANYVLVFENDPFFKQLAFNDFVDRPERLTPDGKSRAWTDTDDSEARIIIENNYEMRKNEAYIDAFNNYCAQNRFNPIKDAIEGVKWDGIDRIADFLHKWVKCEDTAYTRECSRLIFAGGIHRLYHPGCKFDDMVVLYGQQGGGKSTIVRWLALSDEFAREVNDFSGKESVEALSGAWVCEVSELLAMTKQKEAEAVKSFITRQKDTYREAYGRRTVDHPRTCVFIGTTNRPDFITDKTGGRRFYPITCQTTGYELADSEQECREYIKQCWAEALQKLDTPFMQAYADSSLVSVFRAVQEAATEEDWREGYILEYLEHGPHDKKSFDRTVRTEVKPEFVCIKQLWDEALEFADRVPTPIECRQIGAIMNKMPGWVKGTTHKFEYYGTQKTWRRLGASEQPNDEVVVYQSAPKQKTNIEQKTFVN